MKIHARYLDLFPDEYYAKYVREKLFERQPVLFWCGPDCDYFRVSHEKLKLIEDHVELTVNLAYAHLKNNDLNSEWFQKEVRKNIQTYCPKYILEKINFK